MPGYLHSFVWMHILWPLLVITGLVSLAVWWGYLTATRDASGGSGKALLVIFSFSILGITIGWLTGDSGQQVLASVLPAVLTLIGGLAVFLVGKQLKDAVMIAAALTGLTLNLLVGALLASENDAQARKQAWLDQVRGETNLDEGGIDKLQDKIAKQLQTDRARQ